MDGPSRRPYRSSGFILIYWVIDIPLFDNLDFSGLSDKAQDRLNVIGEAAFIRACYAMLAIFCASIVLWITEAVQSYLTSLMVIMAVILCGVTTQKDAFAQLGHPVMWLNILSFVLASMLVKTRVAKRFALWFVLKFGKSASGIFFSFLVINVVLSMFISATTVKATILLPIFMVVAAIFGASQGNRKKIEVMSLRSSAARIAETTKIFEKKIILYRKRITIDGKALAENDDYPMRGLNEIMRLHLNRFTYKMDNPEIPVAILDDDEIAVEKVQKSYYLNIVFQLHHADQTEYRRFRVVMTRDGILRIEEK